MSRVIKKFGGTSLRDMDCIRNAAGRIKKAYEAGDEVVVAVSAMAGTTDRLISQCIEASALCDEDEFDVVVSTGEQVSAGLLAIVLKDMGVPARSYSGWQVPIHTDQAHGAAIISRIEAKALEDLIRERQVPVVAGFQGLGPDGRVTTIGRGGTDLTAVALAHALGAERCDIYTDVSGVYSADPRVVARARHLAMISYEEMLEMTSVGAKVLQQRAVALAMSRQVRIQVLSSFGEQPGTLVVGEDEMVERQHVSGIAFSRDVAKLTLFGLKDRPGTMAALMAPLSEAGINVDLIVQNVSSDGKLADVTFTVKSGDFERGRATLAQAREALGYSELQGSDDVAKVSVIGLGMRGQAGIAGTLFQTLADKGINIQAISSSDIKISILIAAEYAELAVRALHTAYGLDDGAE
ncbi:MAG: aspartate kinase [Sphingomonadales bacterium]